MPEVQANRTLVKSPPELWAEFSDAEALTRHLAEFGEIRITRLEPERIVAWEGEHARGTVGIGASGWGTRVSLTATVAPPEPPESEPAPARPRDRVDHLVRVVGEELVIGEWTPPAAEAPVPEPARRGWFARVFGGADTAAETAAPAEPAAPEPERYELHVVHAVAACRVPARPPAPPPPTPPGGLDAERAAAILHTVLDHLGAAHHRPFSRG